MTLRLRASPSPSVSTSASSAAASAAVAAALRHEALRDALLATVDLLKRRRAAEIPPTRIDEYVTLNWLEWNGGSLRLTIIGENICRQLKLRGAAAASADSDATEL